MITGVFESQWIKTYTGVYPGMEKIQEEAQNPLRHRNITI